MTRPLWITLTLSVAIGAAHARQADAVGEAQRHYRRAMAHYRLDELKPAIAELQEAYRLHPVPEILYNLAVAYRDDGDREHALAMFRNYLRTAPGSPIRADVERKMRELERDLEAHPTSRAAEPPPLSSSPSPSPSPSSTPSPSLPPTPSPTPSRSLSPTPPAAVAASLAKAPPPGRTPLYKKWWVWTLTGVVVAGAAVGLGVGLSSSAQAHAYPSVAF